MGPTILMARFELYGTESLFVVFYLDPQRHSALSIPVALFLGVCCGCFRQVKMEAWKQGIMDMPRDGPSGSNSHLPHHPPPQRDAVHMLISINNGCQKSGLETWGREHLVLPREIRKDFPQEGASEVVLGGPSRSLTGREQRKGMFQREESAHKGLES